MQTKWIWGYGGSCCDNLSDVFTHKDAESQKILTIINYALQQEQQQQRTRQIDAMMAKDSLVSEKNGIQHVDGCNPNTPITTPVDVIPVPKNIMNKCKCSNYYFNTSFNVIPS